jgi:fumarylacetoacetate (FAA) hydrolase family protein
MTSTWFWMLSLLLWLGTFFAVCRDRNRWRDRANEAEVTVGLQQIEINHLRDAVEYRRKLTPWAEKKNG